MDRVSNSIIEDPRRWAYSVAALALSAALIVVLWLDVRPAIRAWGNAPANLQSEITQTRLMVARVIDGDPESGTSLGMMPLRDAIQAQLEIHLSALNSRISELTSKDGRIDQAITAAGKHLGEVTETAERLRGDVNAELASLNATVAATAAPVQSLVKDGQDSLDDLYWDVKASVESATVATTSVAHAMESVRDASPKIAASIVKIGQNSDEATRKAVEASEQTRRLMFNLAENTTPLPKYIRWPAQIVGIIGTATLPIVTIEQMIRRR